MPRIFTYRKTPTPVAVFTIANLQMTYPITVPLFVMKIIILSPDSIPPPNTVIYHTRISGQAFFFPSLQHDPENNKACVPGGEDGNYIMYARATSGDKKNNRQFSPCSLKSVREVSMYSRLCGSECMVWRLSGLHCTPICAA